MSGYGSSSLAVLTEDIVLGCCPIVSRVSIIQLLVGFVAVVPLSLPIGWFWRAFVVFPNLVFSLCTILLVDVFQVPSAWSPLFVSSSLVI